MTINRTRKITVTAMLSAVAIILMYIQIPIPIMPPFIKLDISDLPALIASMAIGPWWGLAVCAMKNVIHMFMSSSIYVGELSNFLLGCAFVVPVGLMYKKHKTKKSAAVILFLGAVIMSVVGFFTNYFIIYPLYDMVMIPMEGIIAAYKAILPFADTLPKCLLIFNVPFTFFKGILTAAIMMVIYKRISKLIKG